MVSKIIETEYFFHLYGFFVELKLLLCRIKNDGKQSLRCMCDKKFLVMIATPLSATKAVMFASTPKKHLRNGYFLVRINFKYFSIKY